MVHLPRTCAFCGAKMMHYGSCTCAEAALSSIAAEREDIKARLAKLDELERDAVRRRLVELGVVT